MGKSKTSKFYAKNKKSREKHSCDNSSGCNGKYAHCKKYKRKHAKMRSKLKIGKGSKMDASKQPDGSYKAESRKTNRGRGGRLSR